jgi:uncharacterized protein GlcG (DUF336 family)
MDHAAYLASVELAPDKIRPAALFKKRSQAVEDAINRGRAAAVAAQSFTEMQGGLPIVVDGKVSADGTALGQHRGAGAWAALGLSGGDDAVTADPTTAPGLSRRLRPPQLP